jgi:hypothetical protein
VLEFLSYLEEEDDSVFGARPTPTFIRQLLSAVNLGCASRSGQPSRNDQAIIKKLIDVSGKPEYWGFDGAHGQGKLSLMLVNLGLAHWNEDEEKVIPTDALYHVYGEATGWDLPEEL